MFAPFPQNLAGRGSCPAVPPRRRAPAKSLNPAKSLKSLQSFLRGGNLGPAELAYRVLAAPDGHQGGVVLSPGEVRVASEPVVTHL
jgi:hypothetical protein